MALAHHHRTARLTLRPVAASDEAAVVMGVGDIAVSGWLAVVPHPYSAADFRAFLTTYAVAGETFAIDDEEGFAGIMGVEDGILGYWIAPRAQGRGYATETARCLVAAHFDASDTPLASGCFEGNQRSAKVSAKLGFVEVGRDLKYCRARDAVLPHVIMRLTREAFV
ncbi:GNAT family N-acetyltransferase [Tabrizicola sp.]|uniref:GNAT family N-acetyltransferase n=1 Tax=Tabrizicola sp. TaxID=2005166 RepID=UPI0025D6FFE7|nr:GNAT family N-acetyltransferase [Tabrizicola sp.]